MGVSIQVYRCRIGNFNSSTLSPPRTRRSPTCSATPSQFPGCCWAAYLLIFFVTFQLLQHQQSYLSSRSPEQKSGSWTSPATSSRCSWPCLPHPVYSVKDGDDDPPDPGGSATQDRNFWARYTNGNRNKGIKICHWNIGGGFLSNKTDTIETLISDYSPHILGISEASFWSDHNLEDVQIPKYKLFLANTLHNPSLNVSRVAVCSGRHISQDQGGSHE